MKSSSVLAGTLLLLLLAIPSHSRGEICVVCPDGSYSDLNTGCEDGECRYCTDETRTCNYQEPCRDSVPAACLRDKDKAKAVYQKTVNKLALTIYLKGSPDEQKVQEAMDAAEQKLRDAFAAAEQKATNAGSYCPKSESVEQAAIAMQKLVSNTLTAYSGQRFVDLGDGTILDRKFGLQWEKKTGPIDWSPSLDPHDVDNWYTWGSDTAPYAQDGTASTSFLATLNGGSGSHECFAGECDWRLPTRQELRSIIDSTRPVNTPAIDPIFGPTRDEWYWSSETASDAPFRAWYLIFRNEGFEWKRTKSFLTYVRAVRSLYRKNEASPPPCGVATKCIFLTSPTFTAALGGVAGADAKCNAAAGAAALPGTYVAWLSDDATNAADRITSDGPYATPSGELVANDKADLIDGGLAAPIEEDETGTPVPLREVWTGSSAAGVRAGDTCSNWTNGTPFGSLGTVGLNMATDSTWSEVFLQFCDHTNSLYCVQQ